MVPHRVALQSRKQLEAIGSPVRLEILRHLQAEGELTVFELARRMARSADGLYYHVRRLIEAGVLVRAGSRPAGRREEALLALAGSPLQLSIPSDGEGPGTLLETGRTLLREVEQNLRDLVPAATNGAPVEAVPSGSLPGDGIDLPLLARMTARLPEEALAEVREHLDALAAIFSRHKERGPVGNDPAAAGTAPSDASHPAATGRHELTVFLLEVAAGRRRNGAVPGGG